MKEQDIILINMSNYAEWEHGVSNRNFHVYRELEKNPDVRKILCVDYPPLTFKRALRNYRDNILIGIETGDVIKRGPLGTVTKISDRVYVYSYIDFFIRPQHFVTRLATVAKDLGFEHPVIWCFYPPMFPYVDTLKGSVTVFDAVDNWAIHSSYKKQKEKLLNNYALVKKDADIIFTVSEELQKLFDNQPNVYWIPNGVDVQHYQKEHRLVNRDISDLPRPIIGYIGVIQNRVDLQLVKFLAEKNTDKSFVIIGPVWYEADIKALDALPNVHLLGYVQYPQAPMYIQQFDVGIIPHTQDEFITSTNPMKMYEYLATGKPVVATAHSGAEMFKDLVYIADSYEDFNAKIQQALTEDSPEKQQERKTKMEKFSWSKSVKEMISLIDKKLNY